MDKRFDQAAEFVTRELVRDTLIAMVDISSPTGSEKPMADFIVDRLSAAGAEAYLQDVDPDRPNAAGTLRGRGDGYNLLFTGHMDTSYSGLEPHLAGDGFRAKGIERDGWIWGLGANNMKSGLAAALVAVEAVARLGEPLRGDITYSGVVGEIEKAPIEDFKGIEFAGYGAGSKYLVTHGVTADFALLSEPTGMRVCVANMGCAWFRVTVRGTVSHSALSKRPGIINAINLMSELQTDLQRWADEYEEAHEYLGEHPNVSFSAIRGGDPWRLSRNPYDCNLYFEVRTLPGQNFETIKRGVRRVLSEFASRTGSPEPRLHVYVTDPGTEIPKTLPIVEAVASAQEALQGETRWVPIRRPGADAVHFNSYGVPCVQFGPGMARTHPEAGGRQIHEIGEHVFIDDVVEASRLYLATALDICSREPRSE